MTDNSKCPAFPTERVRWDGLAGEDNFTLPEGGLTKREYFAGLAMQAIRSKMPVGPGEGESIAVDAVACADALLAELAKERT